MKKIILSVMVAALTCVIFTGCTENKKDKYVKDTIATPIGQATELIFSGSFTENGEFIKTIVSQMGYYGELSEHGGNEDKPKIVSDSGAKTWWELNDGTTIHYITFDNFEVKFLN